MAIARITKDSQSREIGVSINQIVDWIERMEKMQITPSSVANKMPQSLDLSQFVTIDQLRNVGITV